MLVLTRRIGEELILDETIRITVIDSRAGRVRLGITAPAAVRVDRREVSDRRMTGTGTETVTGKRARVQA